ncbi:glycine--tRNA ligase subunit beta [Oceanobacillus bengalensis]|uniref:Glycine--tRNA ligase beta subunit n=1 Tax=Oceanobacillus bengalensis TaxID=1435466 RepID=A0A494Z5L4_9BACI|nr:glycine--tRNA ligase subunit beta [Oceanobacillus bengalensis]RKQ17841.1 glycine--tRNA ligase subunit beta [Oceanobacillus bengalensis]
MSKNVLFEIGLEELPARFVDQAEQQLLENTKKWLQELRISFDNVRSFSTPRRLAVLIMGVAEVQTTIEEEAKGPAEKIAKDESGNWTKAAIGFTKGQGKTVDDIYTKELNGMSYIFVKKHIEGKPTNELLPSFNKVIESIQFGKNMRWSTETLRYARPIRWIVALFEEEVIPFEVASVKTGNTTFGHRFLGDKIQLTNPVEYQSKMKSQYVIVDSKERESLILEGIKELEAKEDIVIPVENDLLNEVRNLVEYPTVFVGSFEEKYLKLPSEVLITSMKEHQRYFPVKTKKGELLPAFVAVRNGDNNNINTVAKGNEKVLRARLADAEFFYNEDKKQSIDYYLEKLERVIFQEKLGTYAEKVKRVVSITKSLTSMLSLDKDATRDAIRAAEISKFDQMTNMVGEFTELQGVIGEHYAIHFGENEVVAGAIREHYLPRQANGNLPETIVGTIVSIADKLDTIVGCISIGLVPTGSGDPYGLRRQATGILRMLKDSRWDISLEAILNVATKLYRSVDIEQEDWVTVTNNLHEFFQLRAMYLLKEIEVEQDIIHAVLDKQIGVFEYTEKKAQILSEKRNDEAFKPVQEAFVRILNLASKAESTEVNPAYFETASEKALFEQYQANVLPYRQANQNKDATLAIATLSELAEPIHAFFDNNMVMADDEKIRNNRLALVKNVALLINEFANLTLIEWKQHN